MEGIGKLRCKISASAYKLIQSVSENFLTDRSCGPFRMLLSGQLETIVYELQHHRNHSYIGRTEELDFLEHFLKRA